MPPEAAAACACYGFVSGWGALSVLVEERSLSGSNRYTDYSSGLNTDRISVPSSAGVTCVTMLTCSTSSSPE